MPRPVAEYSNLLMKKIKEHRCNVYLVNTGYGNDGRRFPLNFTRNCIKGVIDQEFVNLNPYSWMMRSTENFRIERLIDSLKEFQKTI